MALTLVAQHVLECSTANSSTPLEHSFSLSLLAVVCYCENVAQQRQSPSKISLVGIRQLPSVLVLVAADEASLRAFLRLKVFPDSFFPG